MPQGSGAKAQPDRGHRANLTEASLSHHNALSSVDCPGAISDSDFDRLGVTTVPYNHTDYVSLNRGPFDHQQEPARGSREVMRTMISAQRRHVLICCMSHYLVNVQGLALLRMWGTRGALLPHTQLLVHPSTRWSSLISHLLQDTDPFTTSIASWPDLHFCS